MTRLGLYAAVLIVVAALRLTAQTPLRFEVASVKQNVSGDVGGKIQVPPAGTVTYINVPLRILIRDAYQVDAYAEPYMLDAGRWVSIVGSASAGAPQANVPRFDVQGKPPENTAPAERRAMMRALLEDRFKLRVRREPRPMPVYALTVAREGRLGPNLVPSKFDCQAFLAQRRAGGTAAEPVDARGDSWCLSPINSGRATERFAGPIRVLLQRVQPYVDRPIIDATGLSGDFEWNLTASRGPNAASDVPGIFTALQDQLGLKLEARQGPVEVLVIDSVEMPAPD